MCKTWNIAYACSHTFQFRLSTCRGSFTTRAKPGKETKAACLSAPFLTFRPPSKCGPCQHTEAEQALNDAMDALRSSLPVGSPDLPEAEEDHSRKSWALRKQYPSQRFEKHPRPEKGRRVTSLRGSILRRVVLPEEVVVKWQANEAAIGGGWDGWGPDWKSLSDELAERECEDQEGLSDAMSEVEDELTSSKSVTRHEDTTCQTLKEEEENRLLADAPEPFSSISDRENTLPTTANGISSMETLEQEVNTIRPSSSPFEVETTQIGATNKPKILPPHERRRQRISSSARHKSTTESGKMEVDLLERTRCLQFSIAFST